jgi:DNA-binding transcriptional regulator YhcF (GntR family)
MGEKPNKFFLQKGKERSINKVIRRLVKDNGEEMTEQEILKEQQEFYKKIYKSTINDNNKETEGRENILKTIQNLNTPKISEERWEDITTDITEEELWKIIQSCPDNKAPGTDGLNNNFYKTMWVHIKKYLLDSLKSTLNRGELSISQKHGVISLIPKPNKDATKLKNWRPITLLNQDYKYLAKCLANRCKKVLPDIINPDQTGFVPNRLIGTNIIKTQSIINYMEEEQEDGYMVCIDYEKAFDTVEWSYIKESLKHFNFPPKMIAWINSLYNNISTCIINNGHTSKFFNPTRGVRQGCPLSPILFVISVELMAESIRQNKNIEGIKMRQEEIKISQFADDTTFYIKASQKNIDEIFKSLEEFSKITGLKINKEKTEILPLGTANIKELNRKTLPFVKESVKTLGVLINKDKTKLIQQNFDPIIEKIDNSIKFWQSKGLSLQGRITIVKTQIVSKLVYVLNVLPSPHKGKIKEIQDKLYKFIWDNKQDKIKRETLIGDYADGGLKMPDITSQNTSLKTMWIKRVAEKEGNWSLYIRDKLPLNDIEYFMDSSINYGDIPTKPHKDNIWNEAILNWCILNGDHTNKKEWNLEDIYQENLWWNSNIKINNKVIEYKKWAEKGIKRIHHLLTEEGNWMSHTEFQKKYNITIPFTKLYGIQKAIKNSWGDITKQEVTEIEENRDKLVNKLESKQKGSQIIYWLLVKKKNILPTTRRKKWEMDIGEKIAVQYWRKHMVKMKQLNESTKMQTWTYKFLMRIVPYNTKLHTIKKKTHPSL